MRRYSGSHETSDLRSFTFEHRKRATENRTALLRRFRHAPSPDHPRQRARRTRLAHSPLSLGCGSQTVRDAIHDFDRRGLDALVARSSRPKEVHAAFDEDGAEALWEILHQDPRSFGKGETFWTLAYAAEVSFEQGITERRVTGETIRATLARMGVRWERAKRWIESPDPEYGRKKGLATG